MATRLQSILFGLGSAKQTNISTISPTFQRMRQLSTDVPTLVYGTETDKDEIGKGNEYISQVFPTAYGFSHSIDKYSSAEFTAWAWGYALGGVTLASSLYTILPKDPAAVNGLELPYFSVVAQLAEGGGMAIDEAYLGCQVEEVSTTFHYGPGRASSKTNVTILGSGKSTIPSGVTLPATLTEYNLLSQSMTITINGIDYVAGTPGAKTILMGSLGWKNNLLAGLMYFPGSGTVNSASVGGRIFYGSRVPMLNFSAFLQADSTEYAKLIAQITGTASLKLQYDATHYVQWDFPSVSYSGVTRGQEEGIVSVNVEVAPKYDAATSKVLTVTSKNALTDICQ